MSWLLVEFACDCGNRYESLEPRGNVACWQPCPCGGKAERAISAVKSKTVWASVSQGKSDSPPTPMDCDTRAIADGQGVGAWRRGRKAEADERRRAWVKQQIS